MGELLGPQASFPAVTLGCVFLRASNMHFLLILLSLIAFGTPNWESFKFSLAPVILNPLSSLSIQRGSSIAQATQLRRQLNHTLYLECVIHEILYSLNISVSPPVDKLAAAGPSSWLCQLQADGCAMAACVYCLRQVEALLGASTSGGMALG